MTITFGPGVTIEPGIFIGDLPAYRSPRTITTIASGRVSTTQVKFGSGSYSSGIAGALGGLKIVPTTGFGFGLGDFTIEHWYYPTGYSDCISVDLRPLAISTGPYPTMSPRISGSMTYYTGGIFRITSSTTATPLNQWSSVAVVRYNGNTRLYVNGVQEGITFVDTTDYQEGAGTIGCRGTEQTGTAPIRGYMDEIRVSNIARYTSNYTPATQPFVNDPYTLLLIHCDGTNGSSVFTDSNNVI